MDGNFNKEPLFISNETVSKKSLYETFTGFMTGADKFSLFLLYFIFALTVAVAAVFITSDIVKFGKPLMSVYSALLLICSAFFIRLFPRIKSKIIFKRFMQTNDGSAESSTLFFEDRVVIASKCESRTYFYDRINYIIDKGRSIIIRVDNTVNVMISKDDLTIGSPEDLYAFLLPKASGNYITPSQIVYGCCIGVFFCIILILAVLGGLTLIFSGAV